MINLRLIALLASATLILGACATNATEQHHSQAPEAAQVTQGQTQHPGAPAQPTLTGPTRPGGVGTMGQGGMMGQGAMMGRMGGMRGSDMIDRIEGRIAFLRAELKITEAQLSAWNELADALRGNAMRLGAVRAAMMQSTGKAHTLVDHLDHQERWLAGRLEGLRSIKAPFLRLYAMLSDEQKETAEEIMPFRMGMM